MTWYENAVFYELYLRAFFDSNSDGYGDLAGLRQRLDYLEWLGVDCIWLPPIFPSPMRDDGYDISSYFSVDPIYGLMEDFKMTVDEIHRRGMRVVIDLVMNHTSDEHPWFKEARRSKDSPLRDYYVWSPTQEKYEGARIIFLDTESSNWAYDEMSGEYYWHRFYSSQPDLNYDNPKVHEEMLTAMRFWLDMGIDGFRVDAIPYLYEREETNCENLDETHVFIKKMRNLIDTEYPGRLMLAEANQWPQDLIPYFGDTEKPDEFQMCFNFPLMPRLFMALARRDRQSIVDIVARTPDIPEGCQWATFLRNHDELTLEMVTEEERYFMWDFYASEPRQRLNLGIRRRLAPLVDNDRRRIELLHSILLTLPGAPVLYYGDEIGMGDNIELPDRNGVRTPMQWNNSANGGFSNSPMEKLYSPPVTGPDFGYTSVNVETQRITPGSLLQTLRQMLAVRKAHPTLARSQNKVQWLDELPRHALAYWREDAETRILALHNLADVSLNIELPEGVRFIDMLRVEQVTSPRIELPGYGYCWLKVISD